MDKRQRLARDNVSIADNVAKSLCKGGLYIHLEEATGAARLALCVAADSWDESLSSFRIHAYWKCRHAVQRYFEAAQCGRIGGKFPVSLDALEPSSRDAVVDWSTRTFAASPGRPVRVRQRLEFCKRGHEFTPENTLSYKNGRSCRRCKNERERNVPRIRRSKSSGTVRS